MKRLKWRVEGKSVVVVAAALDVADILWLGEGRNKKIKVTGTGIRAGPQW